MHRNGFVIANAPGGEIRGILLRSLAAVRDAVFSHLIDRLTTTCTQLCLAGPAKPALRGSESSSLFQDCVLREPASRTKRTIVRQCQYQRNLSRHPEVLTHGIVCTKRTPIFTQDCRSQPAGKTPMSKWLASVMRCFSSLIIMGARCLRQDLPHPEEP